MKYLIELLKFGLLAAAIIIVGFQFLASYKSLVRNQAIDGCYNLSFYQIETQEGEGKTVTTRETQKYIYDRCLLDKGIVLAPAE